MPTASFRLPPPRLLAPGFPNDPLGEDAVRAALGAVAERVEVTSVVRRLHLLQELVIDLEGLRDGRSMADLADRIGVSPDTVYRLFSGQTWPALDVVAAIGDAVDRPLAFTREGYGLAAFDRRQDQIKRQREVVAREVGDASAEAVIRRLREDPVLRRRVLETLDFGS